MQYHIWKQRILFFYSFGSWTSPMLAVHLIVTNAHLGMAWNHKTRLSTWLGVCLSIPAAGHIREDPCKRQIPLWRNPQAGARRSNLIILIILQFTFFVRHRVLANDVCIVNIPFPTSFPGIKRKHFDLIWSGIPSLRAGLCSWDWHQDQIWMV